MLGMTVGRIATRLAEAFYIHGSLFSQEECSLDPAWYRIYILSVFRKFASSKVAYYDTNLEVSNLDVIKKVERSLNM